jgi:NitT/TauT family transport system ATP-binding protein
MKRSEPDTNLARGLEPIDRESDTPVLDVQGLGVTYGADASAVQAIAHVDFHVAPHEFVCVVGPSGCGKSTLLRVLAGLLQPTTGRVFVQGVEVDGPARELAVVFQEYQRSLLPWLTVGKNVTFPLAAEGLSKAERDARAASALREVGLDGKADRYPWQLSGGMQQRVAIARAIAYRPAVLLMDEPFASVDAQTRSELEDLMLAVSKDSGMTIVFVTHDIDEAVYLGDRVLVLTSSPSTIRSALAVELPYPRDQLSTKAHPEFIRLRAAVLRLIHERSGQNRAR